MFGNTWSVGRVFGVEIKIDASWTIIALLIVYTLFLEFSRRYQGLEGGATLFLAVVVAVLFFGSVLVHELAHSLMSLRRDIPVQGITLFLFGGATHAKLETREPKDEFLIAVVGPLTSFALAGLFWVIYLLSRTFLVEAIAGAFQWLALINLILAVFNLVPGFPLDGGRLLRSVVWQVTGSLPRSTRIASRAGQGVGYLLIALGVFWLFTGNLIGGIWFAAIGWFLAQAAWSSYAQLHVRRILETVEAEDVMHPDLITIPSDISLQQAVDHYFMRYDHNAFPVTEHERVVGLLTLRAIRQVPRDEWDLRHVWHTMTSLEDTATVTGNTRMDQVLEALQDEEVQRVLVTQDGRVVGIITPRDVARWLRRSKELGLEEVPG